MDLTFRLSMLESTEIYYSYAYDREHRASYHNGRGGIRKEPKRSQRPISDSWRGSARPDAATRASAGVPRCLLGTVRDLSGGSVGQNRGREGFPDRDVAFVCVGTFAN